MFTTDRGTALRAHPRRAAAAGAALVLAVGALAACGSGTSSTDTPPSAAATSEGGVDPNAPELSPPGDIPDNQAFVPYTPTGQPFTVSVPEGWARTGDGSTTTTFTDKLNSVTIDVQQAQTAPTVQSVQSDVVPRLEASVDGFQRGDTTKVTRNGETAILTTYRADAAPDPVTGKVVNDDVERYAFYRHGTEVVLTLAGPHGADNVDPWKTVTDSFTWSG